MRGFVEMMRKKRRNVSGLGCREDLNQDFSNWKLKGCEIGDI